MNVEIKFDKAPDPRYFDTIRRFYGDTESVENFIIDTKKGLDKVLLQNSKPIFVIAAEKSQFLGQLALIPISHQFAFFGFFECLDEVRFLLLWNKLTEEAKKQGFKKLFGPVNGTIWHPYRFISKSDNEPFFPSEPISKSEYSQWFERINFQALIEYHSAYRTDFSPILASTELSFKKAMANDIAIGEEHVGFQNISELFDLSTRVFSVNPGFVPITLDEFVSLYSSEKLSSNKALLYTARFINKLIGFCLNLEVEGTLIMKTIAVAQEWQMKGIGNALVHKVHIDAIDRGFAKVIYALVRKDNNVKYFPTEKLTVFREYKAYQFDL